MRFFDLAMKHSPMYQKLKHENEALRERYALYASANGAGFPGSANCDTDWALRQRNALYASANGAGFPGYANCDTDWARKFEQLDRDYRALEEENASLRVDATLGAALRRLLVNTGCIQRGE